ncbi:hypothetical protein CGMCC3_g17433 [Colletotrichum fructicola]|nr:uncharacterized protein CGMCC3_g17433 [Colletotrichum fructicola]KAE9566414.1 hypothetical protein CGMCC3_g17433 [Colletotrichum fructicola]
MVFPLQDKHSVGTLQISPHDSSARPDAQSAPTTYITTLLIAMTPHQQHATPRVLIMIPDPPARRSYHDTSRSVIYTAGASRPLLR